MILNSLIDSSQLRSESIRRSTPVLELFVKKLKINSEGCASNSTIFAVCPNSLNVLKAALRAAKRAKAPIKFAATLNQVDTDGGYTRWTPDDLVKIIKEESYRIGYKGPIIVAVDHGGPWLKDIQNVERWDLEAAMNWVKKSFESAILAGYDLIHIDPTVDIFEEKIKIETVVDRTVELLEHCESFRKNNKMAPISYEVGTEEVKGGIANIEEFKKFLKLLKENLEKNNLDVWPIFIVGKVGTDLLTTEFDPVFAENLVKITEEYNSLIKGHYTDFVLNPETYPKVGIGAANVGPEFTAMEYEVLYELSRIEEELYRENKIARKSNFVKVLENSVIRSNRWKKWLNADEKNLDFVKPERRDWIIKTSCRYVWAESDVRVAQQELYSNLVRNGIDAENWVLMRIEEIMDKYFRAFNLININDRLMIG
jgi:D-tagatose-1,6-bisphosphate aldolase subunit GatZ/KbaZ